MSAARAEDAACHAATLTSPLPVTNSTTIPVARTAAAKIVNRFSVPKRRSPARAAPRYAVSWSAKNANPTSANTKRAEPTWLLGRCSPALTGIPITAISRHPTAPRTRYRVENPPRTVAASARPSAACRMTLHARPESITTTRPTTANAATQTP